jgi:hypothetical protein
MGWAFVIETMRKTDMMDKSRIDAANLRFL